MELRHIQIDRRQALLQVHLQETGKATLLFSLDGGGWGPMEPEIRGGIILPYRGNTQVPLPVLRKISQGYWPEDSGETETAKPNLRSIDWARFGGLFVEVCRLISQALNAASSRPADQDWRGSY